MCLLYGEIFIPVSEIRLFQARVDSPGTWDQNPELRGPHALDRN